MNVETGEVKPENELTEEEKDSGKWKPLAGNRKQRRKAEAKKRKEIKKALRKK